MQGARTFVLIATGVLIAACGTTDEVSLDASTLDAEVAADAGRAPVDAGPAPRCDDGVLNGRETDIDCGGPCAGCIADRSCARTSDCAATLYCGERICREFPTSGTSCGSDGSVISSNGGPKYSPGSCPAPLVCVFGDHHSCVIWVDCERNQVECCDEGMGGRCSFTGTVRPCRPPTGYCGPRPT